MDLYNKKELLWHRRTNRQNQTQSEQILWERLRNRQLNGLKFRRQHSVESYVIDFYCPEYRVAIEIDGGYHEDRMEYDQNRDHFLGACNIRTIRISDQEVIEDIEAMIEKILDFIHG